MGDQKLNRAQHKQKPEFSGLSEQLGLALEVVGRKGHRPLQEQLLMPVAYLE